MAEFAYEARVAGSATVTNASKGIDHAHFGFSAGQIATAKLATITALATDGAGTAVGGVNFLYEGTDPTVILGHHLAAGDTVGVLKKENIANLKFIRSDSVDAVVTITLEW